MIRHNTFFLTARERKTIFRFRIGKPITKLVSKRSPKLGFELLDTQQFNATIKNLSAISAAQLLVFLEREVSPMCHFNLPIVFAPFTASFHMTIFTSHTLLVKCHQFRTSINLGLTINKRMSIGNDIIDNSIRSVFPYIRHNLKVSHSLFNHHTSIEGDSFVVRNVFGNCHSEPLG